MLEWDEFTRARGEARRSRNAAARYRTPRREAFYISTRPSMAFHGNLQVAIREAKTLLEAGMPPGVLRAHLGRSRAAGRCLQRIFGAVSDRSGRRAAFPSICSSARNRCSAGIALIRGDVARGTVFQEGAPRHLRRGRSVRIAGNGRASPGKSHLGNVFGRSVRSEARRLRGPCGARRRPVPRHPRNRAGRYQRRLHADRIRGRQQALRAAVAHGSGAALPRRRRSRSRCSTRWAGPRGPAPRRASKPKCATWRRSFSSSTPRASWPRASRFPPTATGSANSKTPSNSRETRDQKTAIADIKRDMESPQPMDRLLCGDVGYGKTEVVMRAAFKAMGDGKQVAVLAPTTVLCFQHFADVQEALSAVSGAHRNAQPLPHRERDQGGAGRSGGGQSRSGGRHAPAVFEGRRVERSRPRHHRRRAALRREAQRAAEGNLRRASTRSP